MALNPIQLSEIWSFINLFGLPTVSIDTFVEMIGVMDTKYLELANGDKSTGNGEHSASGGGV